MYLSRIELDTAKRETVRALASPSRMHGALEQCFLGGRQHPLWRVDMLQGKRYILMLSKDKPDITTLAAQFSNLGVQGQIKPYDILLNKLEAGQSWHFRLRANPVYSVKEKGAPGRGKVRAYNKKHQQKAWFMKRAESWGFSLQDDTFDVMHAEWLKFKKAGGEKDVSLHAVTFEGYLTITDVARFQKTLKEGIGRGKAYGLGLLTIVSK